MLKKLPIIFNVFFIIFLNVTISKADLLEPHTNIKPYDVVKIQLTGLQNNSKLSDDFGIKQTWNFAHPNNKKYTGPLDKFTKMIKGDAYHMLIDHFEHIINPLGNSDKWAQYEVIILDKNKIYHKFSWQVEKYEGEGPLNDCWLTTMVSNPIPLGSSI